MKMPNWAALRHAVGGSSLLDRTWLLLMLPTTFATSLLARDITNLPAFAGWSGANVLALVGCWLWVEAADRTLFLHKSVRPVAVIWVVLFGASLGVLKGTLTDGFGFLLGVGDPVGVATVWRSVSNAIVGAVLVPALAAAHGAVRRYHSEYQLLLAQTMPTVGSVSPASHAALAAFAAEARDTLKRVESSQAADTILRLIDERLRPYTHHLWAQTDAPPERLDVRSLLRISLSDTALPMVPISVIYALSVWPVSIELAGPQIGTVRMLIAGLVLYATVTFTRRLYPPSGKMLFAVVHFVVTVMIATALQILQWDRLFGGMPRPSTIGMWGTVAVWLSLLMLFGGAVSVALRARAVVRAAVMQAVGPEAVRAIAEKDHDRLVSQRLASRLHADLQGQLLAAARRIKQHDADDEVVREELAALDQILGALPEESTPADAGLLGEQLQQLATQWHGFVGVELAAVEQGIDVWHSERIVQVVSEALVNAARHGLATTVTVSVRRNPAGVDVIVTDDGIGPRDGAVGLGSTFFAAVSAGAWSLQPGAAGGSVLHVCVTAEPDPVK